MGNERPADLGDLGFSLNAKIKLGERPIPYVTSLKSLETGSHRDTVSKPPVFYESQSAESSFS